MARQAGLRFIRPSWWPQVRQPFSCASHRREPGSRLATSASDRSRCVEEERRRSESNRRRKVLQTFAWPFGFVATNQTSVKSHKISRTSSGMEIQSCNGMDRGTEGDQEPGRGAGGPPAVISGLAQQAIDRVGLGGGSDLDDPGMGQGSGEQVGRPIED
jgi:hypothetical protein